MSKTSDKIAVLFVCLGNICRSPAAEAIFTDLIHAQKLSAGFVIDSAGTSAHHAGEKADRRMIEAGRARQIDITSISRQFIKQDFQKFDHIIVMDDSNYQNVCNLDPNGEFSYKVSKMTDYCSGHFSEYDKVPDPYWGGEEGFSLVLGLLDNACRGLLESMSQKI